MPRPSGTATAALSGYSDSRNWPSGLQPVATESDRAKQPEREGGQIGADKKIDKRVKG